MKKLILSMGVTSLTALAIAGHSNAAQAQLAQDDAGRYDQSLGGVSLYTGYFSDQATDIVMGEGNSDRPMISARSFGPSGRKAEADHVNIGDFRPSHDLFLRCWGANFSSRPGAGHPMCQGQGLQIYVGGTMYLFSKQSSSFVSYYGEGAAVTESDSGFALTLGDGAIVSFPKASANECGLGTCLLASAVKYSNGNTLSYTYEKAYTTYQSSQNRLVKVMDAHGRGLTFSYLAAAGGTAPIPITTAYIKKVTVSGVSAFDSSCSGNFSERCTSGSLPTVSYQYTDRGNNSNLRLDSVTLPDKTLDLTWSGMALVSTAVRGMMPSYVNTFSSGVSSQIDRHGRQWQFNKTLNGSVTTKMEVTSPIGQKWTFNYNSGSLQPSSVIDPAGKTTQYQYDSLGRHTKTTFPEGDALALSYDDRGNVRERRRISKTPGSPADLAESWDFPATCTNALTCNQPNWYRDAKGSQTDYTYDGNTGQLLSVTLPEPTPGAGRPQTRHSYTNYQGYWKNAAGAIVASGIPVSLLTATSTCAAGSSCSGTAQESRTTIDYGPQTAGVANSLLPGTVQNSAGDGSISSTQTFTWDIEGNPLKIDGPLPGTADTTRFVYGAGRRLMGQIGPDPDGAGALPHRALRYSYAGDGRVLKVEAGSTGGQSQTDWNTFSPQSEITNTYNSAGELTQEKFSAAGTTYSLRQYSYDGAGRPECSALRMDPATWNSLPGSACSPSGPAGATSDRITRTQYDVLGRVSSQQSAYGITTANGYPASLQRNDFSRSFTDDGQLGSVVDANGNRTTYEYDGLNRLTKVRYPSPSVPGDSSMTDFAQFSYDANSNLTSSRLRDGRWINLSYDSLNRLVSKDLPDAEPDVTFTHDLLGRMTGAVQAGNSLSFSFDALGRNISQTGPHGTMAYQYDAAGRRTRTTWPDAFFVTYDYLNTGEVSAIRESGAAAGIGVLASYAYNSSGFRTGVTFGNGANISYAPDPASRLTALTHNLPSAGQGVALNFSYNTAGQIAQASRDNSAYVWNGHVNVNRAYGINGLNQYTSAGSLSLAYDNRGNLVTSGSSTYGYSSENRLVSTSGVTLSYDPLGRLYQIAGSAVTRLGYDGQDLVAEYDGNSTLLRRYVHGAGTDAPIVWYEGNGTSDRRWLHADERGSIIATSNSTGARLSINTYDEYGIPGISNSGRFQYTGQTWIPELGMYYYKARVYSPTLGRFMQTDPIGYSGGMNLYGYVGNDPVNMNDPSGLIQICPENRPCYDDGTNGDIVVTAPGGGSSAGYGGWTTGGFGYGSSDFGGAGALGSMLANLPMLPFRPSQGPIYGQREASSGCAGSLLGKAWNSGNTIAGLIYGEIGTAVTAIGHSLGLNKAPTNSLSHNAIEYGNNLFAGGGALTIGNVIIYGGSPADPLKGVAHGYQHEQPHTVQGEILGPLYLPNALASMAVGKIVDGDTHGAHSWNERGNGANPTIPWGCN